MKIVLGGPDGCGKSTVAGALAERLAERGFQVSRIHYRPNLLMPQHHSPDDGASRSQQDGASRDGDGQDDNGQDGDGRDGAGQAARVVGRAGGVVLNPQAAQHRGWLTSTGKLLITYADEAWFAVRRRLRGDHREVVIQERGWWDQAIDQRRYRLHPQSQRTVRTLGTLLPRCDLAVIFTGPPERIFERKPELDIPEIRRQTVAWQRRAPKMARRHVVVDLEELPGQAVERILAVLESGS